MDRTGIHDDAIADPIAKAEPEVRAHFVMRTYGHLMGAIAALVLLEMAILNTAAGMSMITAILNLPWLVILGGFLVAGWMARSMARSAESPAVQYAALALYVVANAIILAPLLLIANHAAPGAIGSAALVTALGFGGLTAVVWKLRADYSFLRGALMFGGIMALVLIVAGAIFGFQLGIWFSVGMIVLAGMAILYDTSNIMLHYPVDKHVAAALELFASVVLLFWYVLRLIISLQSD